MHPVKNKVDTSVSRSCILKIRKGTARLETEKGSNEEQDNPGPKYYYWTEPLCEGRGTWILKDNCPAISLFGVPLWRPPA